MCTLSNMTTNGGESLPEKIIKPMLVEFSAGSTLTPSQKTPGAYSPLVHGADGVSEQVVLRDMDSDGKSSASDIVSRVVVGLAIAGISIGGTLLAQKVVPKIKTLVADWRAKKGADAETLSEVASGPTKDSEVAEQIGDELAEVSTEISSQRWYELFFDAVAHGAAGKAHQAISAESWQALASARVTDDEATQALAQAMRELTPEQVNERVALVLEQHPELLSEDPAIVLSKLFDEGDDALEPLRLERDDAAPETPRYLAAEEPEQPADDDETPQP